MLEHTQLEEIQKKLQKRMGAKRYRHTIGVQYTAVMLAMRYEIDLQQAALAGLLHDCAKYLEEEEMQRECERYHISCSSVEKKQPYLLHAKLGAYYARKKYNIRDEEILSAIRYHTTGRQEMTLLEKIIFTADYMEPHRKPLPVLPTIRKTAFEDIDEAVYLILQSTIDYLQKSHTQKKKKKEIEEHTLQAFQYYKKIHQQKDSTNF